MRGSVAATILRHLIATKLLCPGSSQVCLIRSFQFEVGFVPWLTEIRVAMSEMQFAVDENNADENIFLKTKKL